MHDKLVHDLVLNASTNASTNTDSVSIGNHNAVVVEGWLKAQSVANTVDITLEGSNDRLNWTRVTSLTTISLSSVPSYDSDKTGAGSPVEWGHLRLKLSVNSGTALVDAGLRTYTTT